MKKIYGFAVAAATMMLASCSSDAPEVIGNGGDLDNVAGYIKMGLPEGTRAAGDVKIIFYKGRQVVAHTPTDETNVYAVAQVPDRVVVFQDDNSLNDNKSNTYTTTNKDAKTPAVFGDNTYGSEVTVANIFHTLGNAATATPVDVYLDRTVAEVNVTAENATVVVPNNLIGYTVAFTPEYVYVNGVATKTPVIKSVPTSGKTNGGVDATAANLGYTAADGKGSHWTTTDYAWNSGDVKHYSLTGADATTKANKQTVNIFERARQSASDLNKDFTHVIVAGKYTLTASEGYSLPSDADWDGTFYVYGSDANGNGRVYFTEADVVKAMGGAATDKLAKDKVAGAGMTTHMKLANGETCLKYDKGYVYYSAPIETTYNGKKFGKGVVRNHKYTINVSEIKAWGVAIPDTDEPIIPENGPKDNEESFIKLNIVVNKLVNVAGQTIIWE